MASNTVSVERTVTRDIYRGSIDELLSAGVIEQRHLEPQAGRRKGMTHFMPDGSPLTPGCPPPSLLPGFLSVSLDKTGGAEVRHTVPLTERKVRQEAEPADVYVSDDHLSGHYRGSRAQILRAGIAPEWIDGVVAPGHRRGRRTFMNGETRVSVSVSEGGISIETMHIDYYQRFGAQRYAEERKAWGLDGAVPRPAAATVQPAAPQPTQQYRPLFGDAPTAPGEKEKYREHVLDSLRDLVDFSQTSQYDA